MKNIKFLALIASLLLQSAFGMTKSDPNKNVLQNAFNEIKSFATTVTAANSRNLSATSSSNRDFLRTSGTLVSELRQHAEKSGIQESTSHLISNFAAEIEVLNHAIESRDYEGKSHPGLGEYVKKIIPEGTEFIQTKPYLEAVKSILRQSVDNFLNISGNKFILGDPSDNAQ